MNPSIKADVIAIALLIFTTSCSVGPDYNRPPVVTPSIYKEAAGATTAQNLADVVTPKWWEMFGDPQLNDLEEQVDINNQNVAQAEARYRQARALVDAVRAAYYPTLTAGVGINREQNSPTENPGAPKANPTFTSYNLPMALSWEIDVWGRIRRTVEANEANAQANAADIEAAKLSTGAQLAQAYFQLRIADSDKQLLAATAVAYEKSLELTRNRYNSGVVSRGDVLQAETQLKTTQAQEIDTEVERAQLEHAIALLIGKAPAELSIGVVPLSTAPLELPSGAPDELLTRRPDIAAAERLMASANAQIGIATAAYYPNIGVNTAGGFESSNLSKWLSAMGRFWSFGLSATQTLFDGGLRGAQVDQARANYDATVAVYRQTVLTGYQEVEDNLAAQRILREEADVQNAAVNSAQQSLTVTMNQYQGGIVSYLNVIVAQTIALNNQRAAVDLLGRRLITSVALVKALGGGWKVS